MEGEIDGSEMLDFAIFHLMVSKNWFDAAVCRKGVTEKAASGSLDELALHFPKVRDFCANGLSDSFKLEISETMEIFSWFTKSTVSGFLCLVNAPDVLKSIYAIVNEISQLESTRKFHLSLYTKNLSELSSSALEVLTDNGDLDEHETTLKVKMDVSSDQTKNELLRALDLRLTALREELSVNFCQVLGPAASTKQVSDLAAFCQYFGATEMRNSLLRYLELGTLELVKNASNQQAPSVPYDLHTNRGKAVEDSFQPVSWSDSLKSVRTGISPAKIAEAERQSSSENEECSDSSNDDQPMAERSRALIRSASPRRSASPMRRVQIGRSGSRRPAALTIKSLSYFPARERATCVDADGNGIGNEPERPNNRTEIDVKRISVQDAINLFERKQKDQTSNVQNKKVFNEVSASTNKSVLRRWSAGMGECSKQCTQLTPSDDAPLNTSNNLIHQAQELTIQLKSNFNISNRSNVENSVDKVSADESMISSLITSVTELDVSNTEEIQEKHTDAAEWTRQKEAELNQMLMKLMESKPSKYRSTTDNSGNSARERKGVIRQQYKEKGDLKLQVEADRKQTEKGQLKMMQERLDERKGKLSSKASVVSTSSKLEVSSYPQKSRRNSSPPVLSKKEIPKPAAVRKPPSKSSSPMPTTQSSWPSMPSPRTGAAPSKASGTTATKNTISSSRKPQPMLSPSRTSPKPERNFPQSKGTKGIQSNGKISSKGQENKEQNSAIRNRSTKAKLSAPSGNVSGAVSAKPTVYSKAKKSSVVPLESRPFLKKGSGSSQPVGSVVPKKLPQSDDALIASGSPVPDEEKESAVENEEAIPEHPKGDLEGMLNPDDSKFNFPDKTDLKSEVANLRLDSVVEADVNAIKPVEIPAEERQPDEDLDISSAAWVELDQQEASESSYSGVPQIADSEIAPLPSSSPRVRHSLSQMLQADNGEMEMLEWGNAENPPALIYQKDAPKGLKRLLKFGRKSREVSQTGWSSPSVFSEGEEDTEEARANGKRSTDALLRKATVKPKGSGKQKTALSESYDGGYSSKKSKDHSARDTLSAQSSMSNFPSSFSHKLREGHLSTTASGKAARSFFSLSTFRSSKSTEAKFR